MYDMAESGWRLTKRHTFLYNSLFKLRQLSEDTFMLHLPRARRINLYDFALAPLPIALHFQHEMQAIDCLHIDHSQFVFAGLKNGVIEGQELRFEEGQQRQMQLRLDSEAGNEVYINDLLEVGEGRLANCYNSGNIAIWDVSQPHDQTQPLAFLPKVHEDFVYKLRRVDGTRMVSCGNDRFVNLIDLPTAKPTDSFLHSRPVWCSYPVNENLLCSAGLMGYLSFRDLRSGEEVQTVRLLTSETSFVTRLSDHQLVFGDRRQVSRCDLRVLRREEHSPKGMKVSAEAILVTPQGGVAVGRGGDLCLFERGEQGPVEEKNMKADNSEYPVQPLYHNFLANILNLQGIPANVQVLLNGPADAQDEQEEEEEQEEDEQGEDQEWEDGSESEEDELM